MRFFKYYYLFLLVFLFSFKEVIAQKQHHNWYFGDKAGVSFHTTPLTVLQNSKMRVYEGCTSISDTAGNLLFYTNGQNVWNKNHAVMDNGSGLKGDTNSTQSSLIIPLPGSNTIYYLFTTDAFGGPDGLQYSVIDMAANGGMGRVTQKNILIQTPVSEKLNAALHANNRDVWILTHGWGSDKFLSYLLTPSGLQTAPIISSTGSVHGINNNPEDAAGYMKFSHNYQQIAAALENQLKVELFNFDRSNGKVSSKMTIPFQQWQTGYYLVNPYGIEFSSDNSKLFVSVRKQPQYFIFNLALCDVSDIIQKRFWPENDPDGGRETSGFSGLQIGPNGQIYIGLYDPDGYYRHSTYPPPDFNGFPNPNKADPDSLYYMKDSVISKPIDLAPATSRYGLPNIFYGNYFLADFSIRQLCSEDSTRFLSDSTQDWTVKYKWDFGDPASGAANYSELKNPKHLFSTPGKYKVRQLRINGCITDTIEKEITILPTLKAPLPDDTLVCAAKSLVLDAKNPGAVYKWSNGATSSKITVTENGKYWVKISNTLCEITDTINVVINPPLADSIYGSRSVCPNFGLIDYKVKGSKGAAYFWTVKGGSIISGEGTDSISVFWDTSGTGIVTVAEISEYGCAGDTLIAAIRIDNALQTPKPSGKTDVCESESGLLYSTVRNSGSIYKWKIEGGIIISGDGTHEVLVNWFSKGKGKLSVKETGGIVPCEGDTVFLEINIHALPAKPVITGETETCQFGQQTYHTNGDSGSIFLWEVEGGLITEGQGNDTVLVQWPIEGPENISVKEINAFGCESDTAGIAVNVLKTPVVKAGKDTTICSGVAIKIGELVPQKDVNYQWLQHIGLSAANIPAPLFSIINYSDSAQHYTLVLSGTFSGTGCTGYDTVNIKVLPQPAPLSVDSINICSGEFTVIDAGNPGSFYSWSNGSTSQSITVQEQGWYKIKMQNTFCETTDSVFVKVIANPAVNLGADTQYICLVPLEKEEIVLDAGEQSVYLWLPAGHTGRYFHVNDTGKYFVIVKGEGGCIAKDSVRVLPRCPTVVHIPNSFTPNTDNLNQTFKVLGNDFITFHLEIYNRWGERVFATDNPEEGWDGTYKGTPAPEGVYLYIFSYKGYDKNSLIVKTLKGNITLLR